MNDTTQTLPSIIKVAQHAPLTAVQVPRTAHPTMYSPYVELAVRVMDSAINMQESAKEIASLLTANLDKPLSKREAKRLESLYDMMDTQELRLTKHLNPATT